MKRPGGFDRPAPPPTPAAPRSGSSRRLPEAAPRRSGADTEARAPRPKAAKTANAAKAPAAPQTAPSPRAAPARMPAPATRPAPAPGPDPRDEVGAARRTAAEAARAERRARRALRQATRARRRTEKAEVRRFTARRRRTRIAFLVSGGIVVALAGVVALGAFSPLFALREVRIEGASLVPAGEIQTVVDDQMGTPLPLIDFSRIESGLAGFPLIQSYSTESLPPGTLVVRIVERTPVAVLARNGAFDLVDPAGVVVSSQPERIPGYPLIDLPDGSTGSVDFTAAAEVLIALPADLRAQVDSIRASTVDDVTLTLVSGQRVVWGDASDSAQKAQHLGRLLAQQPGTITEYDVSSPGVGILR